MTRTEADRHYDYYPAFLDLVRKRVVVVGGGEIATGKVRGLLPCGVDPLIVIAPEVSPLIAAHAASGNLTWQAHPYRDGDLAGAALVFAATDDRAANAIVAQEARARRIPVLAVDDIPNCDFIAPAVVKRDHLTVAISTGGHSPAMASHLRQRLERIISPEWGDLLAVAAAVRRRLGPDRARVSPRAWQAALDNDIKRLVWAGELEAATTLLYQRLAPVAVAP